MNTRVARSFVIRPLTSRAAGRERGQAMTEFVVGAVFFLLPLFLILPMIARYCDVQATSAQAARYAAWERTVWYGGDNGSASWPSNSKDETTIRNEGRRRVVEFGQVIAKTDGGQTGFVTAGARNFWQNRDNASPLMVTQPSDATASIANAYSPDTVTSDLLTPITAVTSILGFHLETKGLYTGTSSITVATVPIGSSLSGSVADAFAPGPLTFTDKNVILANGWSAASSDHVKKQTVGLAPLGLVGDATLGPTLQIIGCAALVLFTPEFCGLEIGKIEPEVVPPDRLTGP